MKLPLLPLLILLLALVMARPAAAQLRWVPANNGINGASPRAMGFNRSGDLFAATSMGLYRSNDDGAHWVLIDTAIHFDAMLETGSGTMLAHGRDGLFRSDDGGGSWRRLLSRPDIRAAAVDSVNGYLFVATPSALLYSRDGGTSWDSTAPPTLLDDPMSLAVGPGDILYAGGGGGLRSSIDHGMHWTIYWETHDLQGNVSDIVTNAAGDVFLRTQAGIQRTTDGGLHWTRMSVPLAHTLRIDRNGDLFAVSLVNDIANADSNGLYRSTDNGATWGRRSSRDIAGMWIAPNGELVAGMESGMFLSTDRGAGWLRRGEGMRNVRIISMAGDSLGRLFALVPHTERLYPSFVYVTYNALYRSLDHGENWSLVKDSLGNAPLVVGKDGSLFAGVEEFKSDGNGAVMLPHTVRSTDGGSTWMEVGEGSPLFSVTGPGPMIICFNDPSPNGVTRSGIAVYSFDDGLTWKRTPLDYGSNAVVASNRGEILIAGSHANEGGEYDRILFRSADSGATWTSSIDSLMMQPLVIGTRGEVYGIGDYNPTGAAGNFVYRSTDFGASWTRVNDSAYATDLIVDPSGNVFASGGYHAFRTTDGGERWDTVAFTPLAMARDGFFAFDFISRPARIIFSRDNGVTASPETVIPFIDFDISGYSFTSFVADRDGYLFAGSSDRGIFRTSAPASVDASDASVASSLILGPGSPNPAGLRTSIPFTLASSGQAELALYDMLGRRIATLADGPMAAGEHSVDVDVSTLARGSYLYRLTVGTSVRSRVMVVW